MRPTCGAGLAEGVGRDRQAVDVRRLALVGRHAVRGVALDVLDRAQALADREADVLGGDVVLEVDEGLGGGAVAVGRQLAAGRAGRRAARPAPRRPAGAPRDRRRSPRRPRRRRRRRAPPRGRSGRGRRRRSGSPRWACPAGTPGPRRPRRACRRCGRRGAGSASSRRTSAARRRRSSRAAPGLAGGLDAVDPDGGDPQPAARVGHGAAAQGLDAEAPGRGQEPVVHGSARTSTIAATGVRRARQVEGRGPGRVVRGDDDGALADA